MPVHETKNCPKCNAPFECNSGNIAPCHCFEIKLTIEQKAYLEQNFEDCLCNKCLLSIQYEFEHSKERFISK